LRSAFRFGDHGQGLIDGLGLRRQHFLLVLQVDACQLLGGAGAELVDPRPRRRIPEDVRIENQLRAPAPAAPPSRFSSPY
jgi:hypothetical protein